VQQAGLFVLEQLSMSPTCRGEIRRSHDAMTALITTMNHHEDIIVQQKGCATILNLVKTEFVANSRDLIVNIRNSVLESMRQHRDDKTIQHYGCAVISILAKGGHPQSIATKGGIHDIISAMDRHPKCTSVQKYAISALEQLAYQSLTAKEQILDHSGIDKICLVLRLYPSDRDLQIKGWRGLRSLFRAEPDDAVSRRVEVTQNILGTFHVTFASYCRDDAVVEEVSKALQQLAVFPKNRAVLSSLVQDFAEDHASLRPLCGPSTQRTQHPKPRKRPDHN